MRNGHEWSPIKEEEKRNDQERIYARNPPPLPVILTRINGTYELNWDMQSVAAIVTTIVPLIVLLVFQRQFAAGAETRSGAKD